MDYSKYISKASQINDMTKTPTRGSSMGEYKAPPAGACMLRFVGYVEVGKHKDSYQGQEKIVDKAWFVFEVSGKNYPAREINGEMVPVRITVKETKSLHEKANYRKLFNILSGGDPSIKHPTQLIGNAYRGKIVHSKWMKDGKEIVVAKLRDTTGYTIAPATQEDPVTGEVTSINVPAALTAPKIFLWDIADKEMWDSIELPGQNIYQETIRQALNFSDIEGEVLGGLDACCEVENEVDNGFEDTLFEPPSRLLVQTQEAKTTSAPRRPVFGRGKL
jgi:hypothetical protein